MNAKSKSAVSLVTFLSAALGCGSDSSASLPGSDQRTVVVNASRMAVEVEPASGGACVAYEDECLKPSERCGKHGADVILDAAGKLLDYVCYPGEANLSVEEIAARAGDVAQNQNNAVILLDELDDGVDIEGDLSIDANNVVLYAEDPRRAVIGGSVEVDGNNILIRGIHIRGDLTILANNVTVALSVVDGDLVVQGNNANVIAVDVLGALSVTGNNTKLLGNRIAGAVSVGGKGAECRDNRAAVDTDQDGAFDASELTEPVTCG